MWVFCSVLCLTTYTQNNRKQVVCLWCGDALTGACSTQMKNHEIHKYAFSWEWIVVWNVHILRLIFVSCWNQAREWTNPIVLVIYSKFEELIEMASGQFLTLFNGIKMPAIGYGTWRVSWTFSITFYSRRV